MIQSLLFKLRNKVRCKDYKQIELSKGNRIRYCDISLQGKNNRLYLAPGANLKGVCIEIDGENCSLTIGSDCVIGEGTYLSCRGNNTQLTIGNLCMFSRNVKVMTSDGHDIKQKNTVINPNSSVHIGNHVWLADNSVILKNTAVGNGAIVGINAVVTKNVPENSIAAGNPAKIIKQDITWTEELTR